MTKWTMLKPREAVMSATGDPTERPNARVLQRGAVADQGFVPMAGMESLE